MKAATTIFNNVKIFDGESVLAESGQVVVKGSLIEYAGEADPAFSPPEGANIVDGTGKTLMPSIIDCHVHCHNRPSMQELCINWGITTMIDLHGDSLQENKVMAQKRNDVSDLEGVIFGAGVKGGWPTPIVLKTLGDTPQVRAMLDGWPTVMKIEDAEPFVLNNKKQGAKYVKVFNESGLSMGIDSPRPSFEVLKAVVDSAHKHGMIAVAHATTYENTMEVLYAGIDGLVHGFIDRPISEEMISLFKRNNAFMSPTFAVIEGVIDQNIDEHVEAMEKSGRKHLLDEHSRTHQHCGLGFRGEGASSKYAYEAVTKLREAGVDICCGSDTHMGGYSVAVGLSIHYELQLYVSKCGFTPSEALRSATALNADRWSLPDRGRIKKGLNADLLLVNGDPTHDISKTLAIEGTWRNGQRLQAASS